MRVAVVGHVEWIDFVRVPHVPAAGEIVHATSSWEEPGGGGSVAAVQLAKLAGSCTFYTALGDDELGRRAHRELTALGVHVVASFRDEPTRRAVTFVDDTGERTITVLGARLEPRASDPLPWSELEGADAVYICAGDGEAVRHARRARVLVSTSRSMPMLRAGAVALDALVGSATDPSERYDGDLDPAPRLVVRTAGARGGTWAVPPAPERTYAPAAAPATIVDAYGCGDSFAAGVTFALGRGDGAEEAVAFGARCGAAVLGGRGPYEAQLSHGT